MGKRIFLLLVGSLVLTVAFAYANGNVDGTVLLSPQGEGAAGAMVSIHTNMDPDGDSLTTTTDADGHFQFEDIASGGWGAVATLEGHLPGFGMVMVPQNGGTVHPVIILGPPLEDAGAVEGVVLMEDGTPADSAHVHLAQLTDPMHPHGFMAEGFTNADGSFEINPVPAGLYNIEAGMMGEGFAAAIIEVLPNQTTQVTLTLDMGNHHGGGHGGGGHGEHPPCDSLVSVDLSGTVMVVPDGDPMHPRNHYFLDVNADGEADYRLAFGPPWYDPDGVGQGADRPQDGDDITITGGILTYGEPQIVVVFEINGMFWREPCHHGGNGGWHEGNCNPDSISAIEVEGTAIVMGGGGFHGDMHRYGIDVDANGEMDYMLSFGPPWYDPDSAGVGAERPLNGDAITIVGGLMECENMELGVVIVYEINGMFWREPGDTTGFSPQALEASDPVSLPVSYLTASNYPNPFNPVTSISYGLPSSGNVTLKVFDIVGREVATLVNGYQAAGSYSIEWNAATLPSGIYLYRVSVGGASFVNRMVLMK